MDRSDRFNRFIPFIFEAETVFSKGHFGDYAWVLTERDPNDSGGTTRFGIDKASHPSTDVEHLTKGGAEEIYFSEWERDKIERFSYPFGEAYFDCCVNAGTGRAEKILKKTGPEVGKFLDERAAFYERLADAVSHDRQFLKGWLHRIANLRRFLGIAG